MSVFLALKEDLQVLKHICATAQWFGKQLLLIAFHHPVQAQESGHAERNLT